MKYIGIVGSRMRADPSDYNAIVAAFDTVYESDDRICSGGCGVGADRFAEALARKRGIPILIFYPDWTKHKKRAGLVRNTMIATESDVLIACVSKDRTGGTEDTIKKFNNSEKTILV